MTSRHCLLLFAVAAFAFTCATAGPRKYPSRRPGCELQLFRSPTPQIAGGWDDIGVAEAACYLDESEVACLHRLRVEACRMGGDIVYAIPRRAFRPAERAMVIRAMVAHTLASPAAKEKEKAESALPPPAASNEPIVPLGKSPLAPDGGATSDTAADRVPGG